MRASGSVVFRDLDFLELFVELTLLRRMDVLAEKLVPWAPINHEERLALLANRTKPAGPVFGLRRHEKAYEKERFLSRLKVNSQ